MRESGYRVALADVYSDDWLVLDAAFHLRVLEGATCDGSVLVLHVPDRPSRLQTLETLRAGIPRLRELGFEFARLSDLFSLGDGSELVCYHCSFFLLITVATLLALLLLPAWSLVWNL